MLFVARGRAGGCQVEADRKLFLGPAFPSARVLARGTLALNAMLSPLLSGHRTRRTKKKKRLCGKTNWMAFLPLYTTPPPPPGTSDPPETIRVPPGWMETPGVGLLLSAVSASFGVLLPLAQKN